MISSILLSALAITVAAIPTPPLVMTFSIDSDSQSPTYVSVNLVTNGTAGEYVLKGERQSAYQGTPFSFVGNTPAPTELLFTIDGSTAGAQVPETGNGGNYSYAAPIVAIAGSSGDGRWERFNGELSHVRIPATQAFYACTDTVAGEVATVLSWGVPGVDGELPAGCNATEVILGTYQS